MQEVMISFEKLCKNFGSFRAVDSLSLEVYRGEIFSFLGVNGAGKTTTLRMLTGALQPTSGTVRVAGHDLALEPETVKQITGYIPDRPYVYTGLTGREYLYFVAELYNLQLSDCEARIDQLLQDYALNDWQDELIENYSHGMKQRIATCAALVPSPQLLVVDEPMVGLDPHGAKMLKDAFKRYAQEGTTIFLSTHSLHVAQELSSRMAIIHHGKILIVGTIEELRHAAGLGATHLEEIFLELTVNADSSPAARRE